METMARVLVLLAPGAEEMETVIVVDVLRRAALDVTVAGLQGTGVVTCSRQVKLLPDVALDAAKGPFDVVVLPGGAQGAEALAASEKAQDLLREQERTGRWIAAICAAPIALVAANVGKGQTLTSHPSVKARVEAHGRYSEDRVVRSGKLITSRSPGTAFEFALAIIEELLGKDAAQKVAAPMLLQ
jgi:protein DJ-1